MSSTVFLVSGGFDPLHAGHLETFSVGSNVVVGLNSDEWLARKRAERGDVVFMPWEERKAVLEAIGTVSRVVPFDDSTGTAVEFLRWARGFFGWDRHLMFVNGGDRESIKELPQEEQNMLDILNIDAMFLGGGKRNASSRILDSYYLRRRGLNHE